MWSRANSVFFFSLSVLLALAVGSALTTPWLPSAPVVRLLQLQQLKTLRPQRESLQRGEVTDRAILTFDLDADLRSVFNWNVKQLFVFVTAQYRTPTNGFNEVVIWDRVVNQTGDARLRLSAAFNKYPIIDQHTELRGAAITLALNWDVMPITGLLHQGRRALSTVRMPPAYCTETECRPEPVALAQVERRPAAASLLAPQGAARGGAEGGVGEAAARAAAESGGGAEEL